MTELYEGVASLCFMPSVETGSTGGHEQACMFQGYFVAMKPPGATFALFGRPSDRQQAPSDTIPSCCQENSLLYQVTVRHDQTNRIFQLPYVRRPGAENDAACFASKDLVEDNRDQYLEFETSRLFAGASALDICTRRFPDAANAFKDTVDDFPATVCTGSMTLQVNMNND